MVSEADRALGALLAELIAEGGASAASAAVADDRSVLAAAWCGQARLRPAVPLSARHLFDLASLSKPFTATLALRLDAAGALPLDQPIGEVWPLAPLALARRSLEDLLRHRAGLVAWTPLYRRGRSPAEVASVLLDPALLGARWGTYSDLGYVLWGLSAVRVTGSRLAKLLDDYVLAPAGLRRGVSARPDPDRCVACALDTDREVALARAQGLRVGRLGPPPPGTPQDGNARFLGGYAGHAGLFSTTSGLVELARAWLTPGLLIPARAAATALGKGGSYALGWRRGTRRGSAGPDLSSEAFGHDGFTGGSCWIDPFLTRVFVLLTHRRSFEVDLGTWRRRFHRLAASL